MLTEKDFDKTLTTIKSTYTSALFIMGIYCCSEVPENPVVLCRRLMCSALLRYEWSCVSVCHYVCGAVLSSGSTGDPSDDPMLQGSEEAPRQNVLENAADASTAFSFADIPST